MSRSISDPNAKLQWCELCHQHHDGEAYQIKLYNERGRRTICNSCRQILARARLVQEITNVSEPYKRYWVRSSTQRLPDPPSLTRAINNQAASRCTVLLEHDQVIVLRALGYIIISEKEGGD